MNFDWLKQYMPRGLYGRAALILLVPIITLQVVVSVVFIQRHFEDVTRQMTRSLALELGFLLEEVNTSDTLIEATARIARLSRPLELEVELPARSPVTPDDRYFYDLSGRIVIETVRNRIVVTNGVDLRSDPRRVRLWLDTRYGEMFVSLSRGRVSASNPHQFLVLMIFVGAIMALVAFLFLRNQLRPIRRLSRAAEAFGKGRVVPYKPAGALEVRSAGNAFLDMRNRIERQIEQRTMMLSGVSHDLRTPLTRLKLGLSMMPEDEDTAALKQDVEDMERLLDEFLNFARGDALDDPVSADVIELVKGIVEKAARAGGAVSMQDVSGEGLVMLRPMAITRAVDNLIGNALRYASKAHVSVKVFDRAVRISVEDDGPGIPADLRDEALKPFSRLDQARNQNQGTGVGLGLSISNDIARRHGGSLHLGDSAKLGGLRVDLVLPR